MIRRAALAMMRTVGAIAALAMVVIAGHALAGALAKTIPEPSETSFRVASFNIGYIRDPSGLPRWERRRDAVTSVLQQADADIIAFQEMETFSGGKFNLVNRQLDWVLETLPGFAATSRGDPREFPSTQPILYRTELFEPVDQGWFYFSETPDVLFSRSFDGGFDHYASTATLRHKLTGRLVSLINLHTDIRSTVNRLGAAELIAERAKARMDAGEAVIVLGDFNAHAGSRVLRTIKSAGLEGGDGLAPTFHLGFGLPFRLAIDHILAGPGLEMVDRVRVHRAAPGGRFPSDHFPISQDFRITQ